MKGKNNHVDGLTELEQRSNALMNVIRTNRFLPIAESWIDRDGKEVQMPSKVMIVKEMSKSNI